MNILDSHKELIQLSEKKYKDFSAKLTPGAEKVLGVRVPLIKKLAKDILQQNWRLWLAQAPMDYLEDKSLAGYVIGMSDVTIEEKLSLLQNYLVHIDNWATCDTVAMSLKIKKRDLAALWKFLVPIMKSKEIFSLRFALVVTMSKFQDDEHIEFLLDFYEQIHLEAYYVQMAVAWAVSNAYIKFPERVMSFLENDHLDDFTHNKAIQKCCESFRVTDFQKTELRKLKRK